MSNYDRSGTIHRFHDLMPHRIREVLLVSSLYDNFILAEDGHLTEQIFDQYSELQLSSAPRITHAATIDEAFRELGHRNFDLVIAMMRLPGMDPPSFGRKVKKLYPRIPVVLLAFDNPQLEKLGSFIHPDAIDAVFMWSGDSEILLAIIKLLEDKRNVHHDIETADVRVIIVVEDSIRYHSSFLGLLYAELMKQSSSLYHEGVNRMYKLLHMRSRPKVLFARCYEEAEALYNKYEKNVIALISDIGFPRKGIRQREAGLVLADHIRQVNPELPMLLHSAEGEFREPAENLCARFIHKGVANMRREIEDFLSDYLGFGPFIFRLSNGQEVGRAFDVRDLERSLNDIPDESLRYHALSNHFSLWLVARSEYGLARELRPKHVEDFKDMQELRMYMIATLKESRQRRRRGMITEYTRSRLEPENRFLRVGKGSIGGKARGIVFVSQILEPEKLAEKLDGFLIQVPQTLVLCTGWFDAFMEENELYDLAYYTEDEEAIQNGFVNARLPEDLRKELRFILKAFREPLAIRSSSLLEDSQYQPFAGIYETFMLPNNAQDISVRIAELALAIKMVYASTFSKNAKAYIKNTARRIEEEKMAVVIQTVVGRSHGQHFYPNFSGVAQSYNYYPIGHQKAEEGICMLALGLGRMVVDGGQALRFSPSHPQVLPQFSSPQAVLDNSQRNFWAIEMQSFFDEKNPEVNSTLKMLGLDQAEIDGTLKVVGGVFNAGDDRIHDGLDISGPRVVTFNNVLKYKAIPLAEAIRELLELCRLGMGSEVEIEFAVDMGDWGKPMRRNQERAWPTLSILQLRPIVSDVGFENHTQHDFPSEKIVCKTKMVLGHGLFEDITDLIYVRRDKWDPAKTRRIADEVGKLNKELEASGKRYVLIGPGRWGSADPWLGIPVQWSQISGARVIVEASPKGFNVDPSQGTHFFQNITSLRIGYFTIPSGAEFGQGDSYVNWDYLDSLEAERTTEYLRWVRAETPFVIHIDGKNGDGVITKAGVSAHSEMEPEEPFIE